MTPQSITEKEPPEDIAMDAGLKAWQLGGSVSDCIEVAIKAHAGALAEAGRLQPQPEPLTVAIDVGTLKALVDLVTGSMDFGSGFLVDEDVDTLRTAAIALGLDPMDVTPYDYCKRYPHAFEANNNVYAVGGCKVCGAGKPAEVHVLFEVGSTPEESREDHE